MLGRRPLKRDQIVKDQRCLYVYPDPNTAPRPGVITVPVRPGGLVTVQLDDGMEVTTIPDLLYPEDDDT
jgi:hypothetical protein